MKTLMAMIGAVLTLAACSGDAGSGPTQVKGDTVLVSMPGFSFVPFTASVKVGGVVLFDFPSEPHNVIFEKKAGAPTDIQVVSNRSIARTFNAAGTFPYDCTIHPGMSGVVEVH